MRCILLLSVTLLFTACTVIAGPPYVCVGNNYGVTFNPGSFQTGWDWTNTLKADVAMTRAGFVVSFHINVSAPDKDPDPDIGTYLSEINADAGGIFIFTHGNSSGQLVAYYDHTPTGKANWNADFAADSLALWPRIFRYEDIYYAIGYQYQYITFSSGGAGNMENGFWHNAVCDGDQFTQLGGGEAARKPALAAGEGGCPDVATIYANVNTVWGAAMSDDSYGRSFEYGIQSASNLNLIGTATTDGLSLFPGVLGFSHESGTRVPSYGLAVELETDTHMQTDVAANGVVCQADTDLEIADAWYESDTRVEAIVRPRSGVVDGDGYFTVTNLWPANSGLNAVMFNGDRGYPVYFIVGDGPAASVSGFSVVNGIASWHEHDSYRTDHYEIEQAGGSHGPWTPTGITEPTGNAQHTVNVAGHGPYFRLVEVEERLASGQAGRRINHGLGKSEEQWQRASEQLPSRAVMKEAFAELKAARLQELAGQTEPLAGDGQEMEIFIGGDSATVEWYLADPWRWQGYDVDVIPVDDFPRGPNEEFQNALKQAITDSAAAGAYYFWLIGDDGHPEFADPWPGEWETIRQDRIANGYDPLGQPGNVEIPAWTFQDTLPRGVNWAYNAPHYKSDLPYWNVDDDELMIPDVVGSRLPFSGTDELMAYGTKMASMMSGTARLGPERVLVLVGDLDYDDAGDGALALSAADTIQQEVLGIPTVSFLQRLSQSTEPDDNARTDLLAQKLNTIQPTMVIGAASLSHELFPLNFFDLTIANPWDWSLVAHTIPLIVAQSCGGGGFWVNENPAHGRATPTRALTAWSTGAVMWVGPGIGTNQAANELCGVYLAQELADVARPVAESHRVATARLLTDFADREDILMTVRQQFFLGPPVMPVYEPDVPTAAADEVLVKQFSLEQNYPNPFNPVTHIRFSITQPGPVGLRVYNIAGQLVQTLVNDTRPAGVYNVQWFGRSNQGHSVASGVYLCELTAAAEQKQMTRKMVLLR